MLPVLLRHLECLSCYDTLSAFLVMISAPSIIIRQANVPTLLWHKECLLYYDIWLEVPSLFLYTLVPTLLWYLKVKCLLYYRSPKKHDQTISKVSCPMWVTPTHACTEWLAWVCHKKGVKFFIKIIFWAGQHHNLFDRQVLRCTVVLIVTFFVYSAQRQL